MAGLDKLQTRLLLTDGSASPLGGIKLAGTIRGSYGIAAAKWRRLDSYALVYLVGGGGEYRDALGTRRKIGRGDLLWLFPDVAHSYGPSAGKRWDEIYFVFEGPLFELWRRQKIIQPEKPIWRLEAVPFWFGRLEAMARTPSSVGWEGAFEQLSQFQNLVADMLLTSGGGSTETLNRGWLAKADRLLETTGPAALELEEVAKAVGMSYESFRKKFTARAGMAPAKYRQARVIERACGLLMQPTHSHKEIAVQLGFCDEFHFSKVFRKCMGFSPQAFRLKALGSSGKRAK